ncbi:hypothetical protein, partial [Microvirgula curvata]
RLHLSVVCFVKERFSELNQRLAASFGAASCSEEANYTSAVPVRQRFRQRKSDNFLKKRKIGLFFSVLHNYLDSSPP